MNVVVLDTKYIFDHENDFGTSRSLLDLYRLLEGFWIKLIFALYLLSHCSVRGNPPSFGISHLKQQMF